MMSKDAGESRISLRSALETLRAARRDHEIIIPTMGNAREWMQLGASHPLDFVLVPSAMGHGTSIALGLALAQPGRRVIACMGDGSMLMNLGSLASIVAANASNLVVIVFDNGVYEVTGQQPTPGSPGARAGAAGVDFGAVATACGFTSVHRYESADEWRTSARRVLDEPGPVFITLNVAPVAGAVAPTSPGPAAARARAFRDALG